MLGVDEKEETTLDQQYDALKETLNIVCGNLLPELAGKRDVFDIGSPQIVVEDEAETAGGGRKLAGSVKLVLEDGRCDFFLYIDGRVEFSGNGSGSNLLAEGEPI